MDSLSVPELLILGGFLSKSLFAMFVTAVVILVKWRHRKKEIFTVLCWFLKARFAELSNVHLAPTAHAHSPPFCESYSHCNWFGEIAQKSFFLWLNNASLVLLRRNLHGCFVLSWSSRDKTFYHLKLHSLQTTSQFLNSVQNILKIDSVLWFCKFWCPVSKYSSTLLTKFKFDSMELYLCQFFNKFLSNWVTLLILTIWWWQGTKSSKSCS